VLQTREDRLVKKITIEWRDPTQIQTVYKCNSASYGPDSRNVLLRGVDFPTRRGDRGEPVTEKMLIPLDNLRVLAEEDW
jgi:phage protein U